MKIKRNTVIGLALVSIVATAGIIYVCSRSLSKFKIQAIVAAISLAIIELSSLLLCSKMLYYDRIKNRNHTHISPCAKKALNELDYLTHSMDVENGVTGISGMTLAGVVLGIALGVQYMWPNLDLTLGTEYYQSVIDTVITVIIALFSLAYAYYAGKVLYEDWKQLRNDKVTTETLGSNHPTDTNTITPSDQNSVSHSEKEKDAQQESAGDPSTNTDTAKISILKKEDGKVTTPL